MPELWSGEARGLTWDRADRAKGTIIIDRQLQPIMPDAALMSGCKVICPEGSHWLVAPPTRVHDLRAWWGFQSGAGVHQEDRSFCVFHEARHSNVSLLLAARVRSQ
jgi:hypothetical protein